MILFNQLIVVSKVESERAWVGRIYVYFRANSEDFVLLQKLFKSIVHFKANLHVLVILVNNDAVDVNEVRVVGVLRVPDVVFTIVVKTWSVGQEERYYSVLIPYHQRVETAVKKVPHLVFRN